MQNVGRDPAGTRLISVLAPIQPPHEVLICSIVRETEAYELMLNACSDRGNRGRSDFGKYVRIMASAGKYERKTVFLREQKELFRSPLSDRRDRRLCLFERRRPGVNELVLFITRKIFLEKH